MKRISRITSDQSQNNHCRTRTILLFLGIIFLISGFAPACFLIGDLSGDCQVDIDDLVVAANQWLGSSDEPETGLTARWKLNESSGINAADSSGSGHDGTVVGASWNPAGGILGGALQFDGINDYIHTPSYSGITGSSPRTCTAWIKTDQSPCEIMTWGDLSTATNGWAIRLDETGVLRVDIGGGFTLGTTVLNDDFWHHITVVSDGSTTDNVILYIDGQLEMIGDGIISQSINTQGTAEIRLGAYSGSPDYFSGLIDDARIYDRMLTVKEVWSLARTGTTLYTTADFNADELVNLNDLSHLSSNWDSRTPAILINEFLADNESKSPLEDGEILDGNNESSDWIELYNNSQIPIDISGWYLTDSSTNKTLWQFPVSSGNLTLQPGDYLLVFASGKTSTENPGNYPYVDPAGFLHTNFQLSNNGEYLGLIAADGVTVIHEYNHFELGGDEFGYPEQEEDISYGAYYNEPRYFSTPTPGTVNTSSFNGFSEKPRFNVKGGCYVDGFDLTLTCDTPDAFICYTTDGTAPSLTNGIRYSSPVQISGSVSVCAKAFKPGLHASEAMIQSYLFITPELVSFDSNMPVVVVDTFGLPIIEDRLNKPYTPCHAVVVDIDSTGRAAITDSSHFSGWGQMRLRGQSSYGLGTRRPQYAFETQDEYREDKAVSFLDMPEESDWILNGMHTDFSLMRDFLADEIFSDMGHYAIRDRYVELYLNLDGGAVSPSDYRGVYLFREKIKRDRNRIDITRLDASHNLEPKISGGYIIKRDKLDYLDADEVTFNPDITNGTLTIVDPDGASSTAPQEAWIKAYMDSFESVLFSGNYDPVTGYASYIDVDSWIDHHILLQFSLNCDALNFSHFMYKDRGGKLLSGPAWDYNWAFSGMKFMEEGYDAALAMADDPWITRLDSPVGLWYNELNKDINYKLAYADRYYALRENVLATDRLENRVDELTIFLDEGQIRTFVPSVVSGIPSGWSFAGEINCFSDWMAARLNWMDEQVALDYAAKPPIFSPNSGYVDLGESLSMSLPAGSGGVIYYTLDGTDPRQGLSDGEQSEITLVSEDALKYVLVPGSEQTATPVNGGVFAETWTGLSGTAVSALTNSANYPNNPDSRELWSDFDMPTINYADNYGTRVRGVLYPPATGDYTFWIASDDSSQLLLSTDNSPENASVIAIVPDWTDPHVWNKHSQQQSAPVYLTAGQAYYIEAIQKEQDGGDNLTVAWAGPGISGPTVITGQYLLPGNQTWATPDFDHSGWTSGNNAVFYEQSTGGDYEIFRADGIDIGPAMYNINTSCYVRIPFEYNSEDLNLLQLTLRYDDGFVAFLNGVEVLRDNVDMSIPLGWNSKSGVGRQDSIAITPVVFDLTNSVGLLQNGTNILAIQLLNSGTDSSDVLLTTKLAGVMTSTGQPSANAEIYSTPLTLNKSTCVRARILDSGNWSAEKKGVYAIGPIAESLRISELMYHPADPNTEFIEMQNIGTETINLSLVEFTKGVEFTFGDTSLAPGQYALLVEDPTAFEAHYGTGLNVVGRYSGKLDNDGDRVKFKDALGTTVQSFEYEDNWYELTDGLGFSLTMVNPTSPDPNDWDKKYGWRSSLAKGGTPGTVDAALNADSIVINELLAHSHAAAPDWIELYNTTDQDINIGGWFLSDDDSDPNAIRKYEIPENTILESGDYLVFVENTSFGDPTLPAGQGFGLSEAGETVYLYSGQAGQITGYYQTQQKFDASETGITFGRYEKAELSGGYDFARMANPTQEFDNSLPLIADIVITEIHYNPVSGTDYEFVELYNRSDSTVTLTTEVTTETAPGVTITEDIPWRLEGTGYEFPTGVTMAPGERILVAKNPAMYASAPCDVYGPYDGKLDNGGEEIEIRIPGDQEYGQERYWIPIESIDYDDEVPWPTSADGDGDSLRRINLGVYGRDYSNWQAASPTPGI